MTKKRTAKKKRSFTRQDVVEAFRSDPTGGKLGELLTRHGIGVPVLKNPPPRADPFRPLPPFYSATH